MFDLKLKQGFTLVEVLVTILIIGIVTSITIPSIIVSTKNAEIKVGFKKVVSVLNQALILNFAQDQATPQTFNGTLPGGKAELANFFIRKMNVVDSNMTASNPWFDTADGMKFIVTKASDFCGTNSTFDPQYADCVMKVDVNGDKAPNQEAQGNLLSNYLFRDQYYVVVGNSSVLPASNATNDISVKMLKD